MLVFLSDEHLPDYIIFVQSFFAFNKQRLQVFFIENNEQLDKNNIALKMSFQRESQHILPKSPIF